MILTAPIFRNPVNFIRGMIFHMSPLQTLVWKRFVYCISIMTRLRIKTSRFKLTIDYHGDWGGVVVWGGEPHGAEVPWSGRSGLSLSHTLSFEAGRDARVVGCRAVRQ